MARYIDIEPVLADKVSNAYISRFELEQQPAVDVVEVVRCKDCIYRSQYCTSDGLYKCGTIDGYLFKSDDFCSYGQKGVNNNEEIDG